MNDPRIRKRTSFRQALSSLAERPALAVALIMVIGLLAYSNTLHVPFQWDGKEFVGDNPIVKDLTYFLEPSRAKGIEYYGALKGRYVGYLTFAVNYRLHGTDVTGYHLVNIAVHLLNALLVYLLVLLTFRTPYLAGSEFRRHSGYVALFSGLLFVSHPLQTEAVTYIFQRLASLVAFFYLLSLVLYVKYRNGGKSLTRRSAATLYLVSLVSAILAMKTKENAFTLPVVIALYELFFYRGHLKARAASLVPFFLTMAIIPLSILDVGSRPSGMLRQIGDIGYAGLSRTEYLLTQFRVIVTYIRLLFLPVGQNIDYDYPVYGSLWNSQVALSLLLILGLLCLAAYLFHLSRRGSAALRLISFGILWFFVTLSVESTIIPIPMLIDEYRLYLPSVGAVLAVTAAFFLMAERLGKKHSMNAAVGTLVSASLVFCFATFERNSLWKSEIALWADTARKSPNKSRVYNNLGNAYDSGGFGDRAIEIYFKALRVDPRNAKAYYNLGIAYKEKGRLDDAIEQFRKAVEIKHDYGDAHNNLGIAYAAKGVMEEAIGHFRAAIESNPYKAVYYKNLGAAYADMGRLDGAIEAYQSGLRLEPDNADIHNNLGVAYARRGELDEAVRHMEASVGLNPEDPEARYNLANAYRLKGWNDKARQQMQKAQALRGQRAGGR
jgi:tetratricopeptide (TPR) repeat protein